MGLRADLSDRLDAGSLVTTLLGSLSGPAGQLTAISVPDGADEAPDVDARIDAGAVGQAVQRLVTDAIPALDALPLPTQAVQPITLTLEVIEQVTRDNPAAQLEELLGQLTSELEGTREGGLIAVLRRLAGAISEAPAGERLFRLVTALTGGPDSLSTQGIQRLTDAVPALDTAVRGLGGLLVLESVLAESQRLTSVMAGQLDPQRVQSDVRNLLGCFGTDRDSLGERIRIAQPGNEAEIESLIQGITLCGDRLLDIEQTIAAEMGFGEATLAYLNVDTVQAEVETAATMLRELDFDVLHGLLRDALGGLAPLLEIDLAAAPAQSLEDILQRIEGHLSTYVQQISSFDAAAVAQPLTQGIGTVGDVAGRVTQAVSEVTVAIRSALEQVQDVMGSLPLQEITAAVQQILGPVAEAMQEIVDLLGRISAALETAARTATGAMGEVENTIDDFQRKVDDLFDKALKFVDALQLDSIVGSIAGAVQQFTDLIAQAEMQPYFDTAIEGIDTTTDIVEKVPFDLLPDSARDELDAVVRPIKQTDLAAVEREIESLLQITPDGQFALRGDLEAAVAQIQTKLDNMLTAVREHDPRELLDEIDTELAKIAARIHAISPDLSLQSVQEAIDRVRQTVTNFDLGAQLEPLRALFDRATELLDQYSPVRLIEPLNERVQQARQQLLELIRFEQWERSLDELEGRARALIEQVDPETMEPQLENLMREAGSLLDAAPDTSAANLLGSLLAGLLSGSGARAYPWSMGAVLQFVDHRNGTAALAARTNEIARSVAQTQASVEAVDLPALSADVIHQVEPLRSAVSDLLSRMRSDSPLRTRLEASAARLEVESVFGRLESNRQRYLEALTAAAPLGETLRRTGLAEVDLTIEGLYTALRTLDALWTPLRGLLASLGVEGLEAGPVAMLRSMLETVAPQRLTRIVAPILRALRNRTTDLLDAVIVPLRDALTRARELLDALDLTPLVDVVRSIHEEALAQIALFHPDNLLAEPLAAFTALQLEVATFDPLGALLQVLNALRDTAARVVQKLSASRLLEKPLAIYDQLLAALESLQLDGLLEPILDLLDDLAAQVDVGLDGTVEAFQRLQEALPSPSGSAAAASLAAGAG